MSASPFHNSRRFAGKRLHLGVCGSIACYKALDLLRALHALDIHVSVTLTDGARRFVTPLLFEALGAMPVYGRMFEGDAGPAGPGHAGGPGLGRRPVASGGRSGVGHALGAGAGL